MKTLRKFLVIVAATVTAATADTSITAPDGSQVCIGQTILQVPLDPAKRSEANKCLLIGMIDGRFVVANTDQANPVTKGNLYFVQLASDTKANYSFLEQDRISFEYPGDLAAYGISTEAWEGAPRGQIVEWAFPGGKRMEGGKTVDTPPKRMVLVINRYCRAIQAFDLTEVSANGITRYTLKSRKEITLPPKYSSMIITCLDVIDLNAFVLSPKDKPLEKPYPWTLLVGCKPDRRTGIDNRQLNAPLHMLSCTLSETFTLQTIGEPINFYYEAVGDTNPTFSSGAFSNIIGGGLIAPAPDGSLCYYVAKGGGSITHMGRKTNMFSASVIPLTITMNPNTDLAPHLLPAHRLQGDSGTYATGIDANYVVDTDDYWDGNIGTSDFRRYNFHATGPKISMEGGKLSVLVAGKHDKTFGDNTVGQIDGAPAEEINKINKAASIPVEDAAKSDLVGRQRAIRLAQGTRVIAVLYGFPYLAIPERQSIPPEKNEAMKSLFSANKTSVAMETDAYANGVSAALELGVGASKGGPWEGTKVSAKSAYEYKNEKQRTTGVNVSVTTDYAPSPAAEKPFEFFDAGCVISTGIQPTIQTISRISAIEGKSKFPDRRVFVVGLEKDRTFQYSVCSLGLAQRGGAGFTVETFFLADPAKRTVMRSFKDDDGTFETDHSILSAGLTPRPISSLVRLRTQPGTPEPKAVQPVAAPSKDKAPESVDTQPPATPSTPALAVATTTTKVASSEMRIFEDTLQAKMEEIRAWQKKSGLVAGLLQLLETPNSGVAPYSGSGDKGGQIGAGVFQGSFATTDTFSITELASVIQTSTHTYSVGLAWEVSFATGPLAFFTKGEVMYRGSQWSKYQKDSSGTLRIVKPGIAGLPEYPTSLMAVSVDVPALKSYMTTNDYPFEGTTKTDRTARRPGFIPQFCWDEDQAFLLFMPFIPDDTVKRSRKKS
jgi:hypothetical protein